MQACSSLRLALLQRLALAGTQRQLCDGDGREVCADAVGLRNAKGGLHELLHAPIERRNRAEVKPLQRRKQAFSTVSVLSEARCNSESLNAQYTCPAAALLANQRPLPPPKRLHLKGTHTMPQLNSVRTSATPDNRVAATIAILQRELDALREELQAKPPAKVRAETEQQEALLSALRATPGGGWLSELASKAGLSKNVAHTRARQLAYQERIWLSLEPNRDVGKAAFYVRDRGDVEVA